MQKEAIHHVCPAYKTNVSLTHFILLHKIYYKAYTLTLTTLCCSIGSLLLIFHVGIMVLQKNYRYNAQMIKTLILQFTCLLETADRKKLNLKPPQNRTKQNKQNKNPQQQTWTNLLLKSGKNKQAFLSRLRHYCHTLPRSNGTSANEVNHWWIPEAYEKLFFPSPSP